MVTLSLLHILQIHTRSALFTKGTFSGACLLAGSRVCCLVISAARSRTTCLLCVIVSLCFITPCSWRACSVYGARPRAPRLASLMKSCLCFNPMLTFSAPHRPVFVLVRSNISSIRAIMFLFGFRNNQCRGHLFPIIRCSALAVASRVFKQNVYKII